jgi:hypothetical protein
MTSRSGSLTHLRRSQVAAIGVHLWLGLASLVWLAGCGTLDSEIGGVRERDGGDGSRPPEVGAGGVDGAG